jgi:hypothetical protein
MAIAKGVLKFSSTDREETGFAEETSPVRVWTLGQSDSNRVGTRIVTRADVRRAKWKKPKRRKSSKT